MPSPPETQLPHCLLCSMCCPVGAESDRLGHVSSVFPADLGIEQGACVLGLAAGSLLRAENRIYGATCEGEPKRLAEALEDLAGRLLSFNESEVGLLLGISRPLENLALAAALRGAALPASRLALLVPPQDEPFLRAGLGACPHVGDLSDCDVVLTIGDPFSTHPVISRPVRDMQLAKRGNRFLAIDTAPGRTARSAGERTLIAPFKLAGFLCAIAVECGCEELSGALGGAGTDEICGKLAIPPESVRSLASALKDASSPAIVISHARGRYAHGGAVVRAAAELAKAVNAKLFPMPVSPNSPVAAVLAARFKAVSVASLLGAIGSGRTQALLVVGVDPANVFPERIWKAFAEKLDFLAWAGSLRSEFARAAQIVVPLALPWEESGSILTPGGRLTGSRGWSEVPGGVASVEGFVSPLGQKLGTGPIASAGLDGIEGAELAAVPLAEEVTEAVLEVPALAKGEAFLIGAPEPYGYAGGLSVMAASWQRRMAALEKAVLSAALAAEIGVKDGDLVTVSGRSEVTLPCVVEGEIEAKLAALPSHRADLSEMLEWSTGPDRIEIDPAVVKVTRAD